MRKMIRSRDDLRCFGRVGIHGGSTTHDMFCCTFNARNATRILGCERGLLRCMKLQLVGPKPRMAAVVGGCGARLKHGGKQRWNFEGQKGRD